MLRGGRLTGRTVVCLWLDDGSKDLSGGLDDSTRGSLNERKYSILLDRKK